MSLPELIEAIDARDSVRVRDLAMQASAGVNQEALDHLVSAVEEAPDKNWRSTVMRFFEQSRLPAYTHYDFLAQACHAGSRSAVEACVGLGWSIKPAPFVQERKSWGGRNSLAIAAKKNHSELLAYLIEQGLDVNASSRDGYEPLLAAIEEESCEAFCLLREAGATIEQFRDRGLDPFHYLLDRVQYNSSSVDGLRMSKLLIEAGLSLSQPHPRSGVLVRDRMRSLKITRAWVPELEAHELAFRMESSAGGALNNLPSKPLPRL